MTSRKNKFPGSLGAWLVGQLELPEGTPRATALLAHCFTCGKDLKSLVRIARELADRGIASLRFDVTGVGESEGDFAETSFSSIVGDVLQAAAFLRESGLPPQLLVGHSLGGTAMLVAAKDIPESRLVATIAAASDTLGFRETLQRLATAAEPGRPAEVMLGGRRFPISKHLLDDLQQHRVEDALRDLGRPLIVFQSPEDETLPLAEGLRLFDLASPPKSFVCLDGADHLMLTRERDTRYIAEVLAAWVERSLG